MRQSLAFEASDMVLGLFAGRRDCPGSNPLKFTFCLFLSYVNLLYAFVLWKAPAVHLTHYAQSIH